MFEFIIILDVKEISAKLEKSLLQAGCEDGTINYKDGLVYVVFSRPAESRTKAIESTIQAVNSVGVKIRGFA